MATFAVSSTYLNDQQFKILTSPYRIIEFKYEILEAYSSKGFYSDVVKGGTIAYNYNAEIKRTWSGQIVERQTDDITRINFDSDWIKVWCYVTFVDPMLGIQTLQIPMGVFALYSNKRTLNGSLVTRDITGYDLAKLLDDDKLTTRLDIYPGDLITDVVNDLLASVGLNSGITPSNETYTVGRSKDLGMSKLKAINELLDSIGYTKLYFDADGIAKADPYIPPTLLDPTITYETDQDSVLGKDVTQTINTKVPNVLLLVVSQPDRPVLKATFENNDPNSPSSIQNSNGQRRVKFISDNEDATTQGALNAKGSRLFHDINQTYETIDINTRMMPIHGDYEIIYLRYDDGNNFIDGYTYSEVAWSINLEVGAEMSHTLRRIVDINNTGNTNDPIDES